MNMSKCAGCGAEVDGDVCDSRCADLASERLKWQGKAVCADCEEKDYECDWQPAMTGSDYCERHAEQRSEAAYERQVEDYYGSSAPQTAAEHIGRTR